MSVPSVVRSDPRWCRRRTAGKKRPGPQHARAHFPKKQYASSVPARGALDVAAHTPWPHNLFCYVTGSVCEPVASSHEASA